MCMVGNKDEEWKWSCMYICISEAFMIIGIAEGTSAQVKWIGYTI